MWDDKWATRTQPQEDLVKLRYTPLECSTVVTIIIIKIRVVVIVIVIIILVTIVIMTAIVTVVQSRDYIGIMKGRHKRKMLAFTLHAKSPHYGIVPTQASCWGILPVRYDLGGPPHPIIVV